MLTAPKRYLRKYFYGNGILCKLGNPTSDGGWTFRVLNGAWNGIIYSGPWRITIIHPTQGHDTDNPFELLWTDNTTGDAKAGSYSDIRLIEKLIEEGYTLPDRGEPAPDLPPDNPCPDCGTELVSGDGGSGVKCPKAGCGYWFCY